MTRDPLNWLGQALQRAGTEILRWRGVRGTWIDVGAHHGEQTLIQALENPELRVYAFEPNLSAAAKLIGQAPNYFVLPMAVSQVDGTSELHINAFDAASSLLPFNEQALQSWIGGDQLRVKSKVSVPTIRLDSFMNLMKIEKVDFLKIDAQGMDLSVVKSAGGRISDITKIRLEVDVTAARLYSGSPSTDEVIEFLEQAGFSLVDTESQTHNQEQNLTFVWTDHAQRFRDRGPSISAQMGRSE